MADVKRIATRDGYGQGLIDLMRAHDDVIVFDADLAGSTKSGAVRKEWPERHFNCGIAEANMMAAAAGAASMGLICFASSFAMFATGRAYEQIRNSIGYTRLNVKIGASHGGVSVGEDGASHQCLEDFALMRAIPGMVVMSPADEPEARAMVKAAYEHEGPVYMRFGRSAVPVVHREDFKFQIGRGELLREGTGAAILANGLMVDEALKAAELLAGEGVSARVVNMATVKPLDEELVLKAAEECGRIVTCEEHSIIGGLGEAVCSFLSERRPTPVRRIGVNDVFGYSGSAGELLDAFGLRAGHIAEVVKTLL